MKENEGTSKTKIPTAAGSVVKVEFDQANYKELHSDLDEIVNELSKGGGESWFNMRCLAYEIRRLRGLPPIDPGIFTRERAPSPSPTVADVVDSCKNIANSGLSTSKQLAHMEALKKPGSLFGQDRP